MKIYRVETGYRTYTGTKREVMKRTGLSSLDWERGVEQDHITEVSDETFTGPQPFDF